MVPFGGADLNADIMNNPSKLYGYHVKNLRELEKAINNISRLARSAIASNDPSKNLQSLVRLYALLIGCWAETRLKKLMHERSAFSQKERKDILSVKSQIDRWKKLVEIAFRKHHSIAANIKISRMSIGVAAFAYYEILLEVLDKDLAIVIQIRNKLAHGQWVYPLKNGDVGINSDLYQKINNENLLSLQFKFALSKHLAELIHDLAVSPATFQRDFDSHYRKLEQVRINLQKRKYANYVKYLVARRKPYGFNSAASDCERTETGELGTYTN